MIEQYILKIFYKSNDVESSGSGVIINTRMDYFYIFTAKHTFFKENVKIKDMDISTIDIMGIKAENFHDKIICENKSIIEVIEINKQDDFLIIVAKNNLLGKVKPLAINPYKFSECVIYGYPFMKEGNVFTSMDIPCNSPKSPKNNTFEVHSYVRDLAKLGKLDTSQNMKGLSGAGLYTEIKNKIYLSGIQIQGANGNDLLCFDIRALSKDINKVLEEKNRELVGVFIEEEKKKESIEKKILLGVVLLFVIIGSSILFFLGKEENNFTGKDSTNTAIAQKGGVVNQTIIYNKKIDSENHKENLKVLEGYIKNPKKGKIYYLYRKSYKDNNTISNRKGYFKFEDINKDAMEDEQIFIYCCEDKKYQKCYKPKECRIGESCDF